MSALPGPENSVLVRAEQAEIAAAVARLGVLHREVLGLVFVDGLSYAAIAEVIGVPIGTVKSRVFHAKAALGALLDETRGDCR